MLADYFVEEIKNRGAQIETFEVCAANLPCYDNALVDMRAQLLERGEFDNSRQTHTDHLAEMAGRFFYASCFVFAKKAV